MAATLRVGLVLGGGAIQGAAWLEGALAALAAETGWNPGAADVLIGTSAGAWMAADLAAGAAAWLKAAQTAGERIDGLIPGPAPFARGELRDRAGRTTRRMPGSPGLFRTGLRRRSVVRAAAGLVPRGRRVSGVDTLVRTVIPSGWPAADLRCVVCDYRTGARTVLSRSTPGATDAADAVAASCAIPGVFTPVRIGGTEYVDGGLHSVSNLDLAAELALDLVICLNPATTVDTVPGNTPAALAWKAARAASGRALRREARRVRESGAQVLLIQPTAKDIALLGTNWLRPSHHAEIIALAADTVARQLRESPAAATLARLPRSPEHLVRRPDGPSAGWPDLVVPAAWSRRR